MPSVIPSAARVVDMTTGDRPVEVVPVDHPLGHDTGWHMHERGQLIYAEAGVMAIETVAGVWVIPPARAVWVPAATRHRTMARTAIRMRNVFIRADARARLPTDCVVVTVSPLMRELIREAEGLPVNYDPEGADGRLMAVLLDRIETLPATPLHLPMPTDPRLQRITETLAADPADSRRLADWARHAGASARTLARLFHRDLGMTFGTWRQQARLLAALERLAAGAPVTMVALDLGYDSPSAFSAMFKRAFGVSPSGYFKVPHGGERTDAPQ